MRKCIVCNKTFEPQKGRTRQRCCSHECSNNYKRQLNADIDFVKNHVDDYVIDDSAFISEVELNSPPTKKDIIFARQTLRDFGIEVPFIMPKFRSTRELLKWKRVYIKKST